MSKVANVASKRNKQEKGNLPLKIKHPDLSSTMSTPVNQVLNLQQTAGNQAVQELLKSGTLQPKLKIGQPGDKYELEADKMAEQVMRMSDSVCPTCVEEKKEEVVNRRVIQRESFSYEESSFVQRQMGHEERKKREEEDLIQPKLVFSQPVNSVQRQVEDMEKKKREEKMFQAKEYSGEIETAPNVESSINSLKGGGELLSEPLRNYFEPRFGADFSGVRIHTGGEAVDTARSIHARAFTLGNNIFIDSSNYSPETSEGKRLLAHELTHVLQQNHNKKIGLTSIKNRTDEQKVQRLSLKNLLNIGLSFSPVGLATKYGYKFLKGTSRFLFSFFGKYFSMLKCQKAVVGSIGNLRSSFPKNLSTILSVLCTPCFNLISGNPIIYILFNIKNNIPFLETAVDFISNPGKMKQKMFGYLSGMIYTIPFRARTYLDQYSTMFGRNPKKHLERIGAHLDVKIKYLLENWWAILKNTAFDLIWPFDCASRAIKKIFKHTVSLFTNYLKGPMGGPVLMTLVPNPTKMGIKWLSGLADDFLAIWSGINELLGCLYLWISIGLIIGGAAFGGIGAAGGLRAAVLLGEILLGSTVAAEVTKIAKAWLDLNLGYQTEEENEEDYGQIADSSLILGIIGVLYILGAIASRFASAVFSKVKNLFAPRVPKPKLKAPKGSPKQPKPPKGIQRPQQGVSPGKKPGGTRNKPKDIDIVDVDPKTGLPKQLGGPKVGKAFKSFQEAYQERLKLIEQAKAAGKNVDPHIAEIIVKRKNKIEARWWEVSERGIIGHTEQKAFSRINFRALKPGVVIEIHGGWAPCFYRCMNMLNAIAHKYKIEIIYRTTSGATYHFPIDT